MAITLTIRDEGVGGVPVQEQTLDVPAERMTARELIRSRVYQEVQDYNLRMTGPFLGLVRPESAERALNRAGATARFRPVDWKKQFERAVEAFEANQILLLVDDRQVDSLDEEVTLREGSVATFLRLTLLVGG
ncbi:hypothetical protein SAMN05444166_7715 [Singulisphaera sp. GP187]|uniref:hypothetical protein n=1 Tax=Singulisphaera sp. GP187 TaxID=1882752 RepID=UPI0009262AE5|nr:hypothetical protein [Singulisphaera sp. GP187]SIO65510.1 hypothetical protein SAMN05444166_7715 [Singulisphaera sp. GP187]